MADALRSHCHGVAGMCGTVAGTVEGRVQIGRRATGWVIFAGAMLLADGARADEPSGFAFDVTVQALAWMTSHVNGILVTAYDRAPVLVVVLAMLLVLPLTALAAMFAQSLRLKSASVVAAKAAQARSQAQPPPVQPVAWLTSSTGEQKMLPAALSLVRIGRHEDNDIRLVQSTVHRHHAIIHRTADAEFVITDVSGAEGNGIVINGQRLNETRLRPGDTIQLGDAALTFDSALPAYLAALRTATSAPDARTAG
jgi:hypothetical protein